MSDNVSVVITEIIPTIAVDTLQTIIDVDITVSEMGSPGVKGDSAYEVWLAEGHTGSEQDYLSSLIGADGTSATITIGTVTEGPAGVQNVGTSSTAIFDFQIPKGENGNNVLFEYSVDTTSWHTSPSTLDYYFRTSTDLGVTWSSAVLYRGAKGDPGTTTWEGITDKPETFVPEEHGNESHSSTFATTDQIPTALAELTDDETHRTVTDDEKTAWNAGTVPGGNDHTIQFNDDGVFGGVDAFRYDPIAGAITIGEEVDVLPNVPLAIQKDEDTYVQVTFKNKSDADNASMDIVITADNGTDETHYMDLGVNSSGYDQGDFPIFKANDGYLYTSDDDLDIGTGRAGKTVNLFAGGFEESNISARIDEDGVNLPAGKTFRINGEDAGSNRVSINQSAPQTLIGFGRGTRLLSGGVVTANGAQAINISAGSGVVYDSSTQTETPVTWEEQTSFSLAANITAGYDASYILVDSTGAISSITTDPTPMQIRDYVYMSKVAHRSGASITAISNLGLYNEEAIYSIRDLAKAIGPINIYGNVYSNYGTGLQIQKSAGRAYRYMWWSGITRNNPSYPSNEDAAVTPVTFVYCQQKTGGGVLYTTSKTAIDPTKYDIGDNTLDNVPSGKYTIQRVYYFPKTNSTYIFYDRKLYDSMADAENAVLFASFALGTDFFDGAILRSFICLKHDATDLSNTSQCVFLEKTSGSAGGSGSGGGNTATNVGLTGQSIVNGKVGVDLQFNSISSASSKITVALDTPNKSVTVDLGTVTADDITDGTTYKRYSDTDKTKLAGIASGAEVNVQSDWNELDTGADSYIKNKPSIPGGLTPAMTVVSETAYSQAASVGTSTNYARADHTHGTPAAGSGGVSEEMAIAYSAAFGGI